MAAIAFSTAGRFGTMLIAARKISDAFAIRRLRLAAAEADAGAQRREGGPPAILPAENPTGAIMHFQPLDSTIIGEAISSFFIGRNSDGFWVARAAHGRGGGIFLLQSSALSFARRVSQPGGCATIFPDESFELDLPNGGNRLLPYLGSLMRVAKRGWRPIAGLIGTITTAVSDRGKGSRA